MEFLAILSRQATYGKWDWTYLGIVGAQPARRAGATHNPSQYALASFSTISAVLARIFRSRRMDQLRTYSRS